MKIIEYYATDKKEHWLNEIKRSDWKAGQFLYELLRDNRLKELCGENAKVLRYRQVPGLLCLVLTRSPPASFGS